MQESESYVQDEIVSEKRIRSRCRGLLEVTSQDGDGQRMVQFMHQSVKDFLVAEEGLEILDPGWLRDGPDRTRSCLLGAILHTVSY